MPSILQSLGTALGTKLGEKLNLTGGTITGALVVPVPTASNHVAQSNQVTTLESAIGNYGDFVATTADVTVTVYDTAVNIQARTGDAKGAIGVASDTDAIYVFSGIYWSASTIETVKADSLAAALTLKTSGLAESDILARTGDSAGTIYYGTDTDDLYIFDGADWQTFNDDA